MASVSCTGEQGPFTRSTIAIAARLNGLPRSGSCSRPGTPGPVFLVMGWGQKGGGSSWGSQSQICSPNLTNPARS